jgi:MOSC domain-containing protein YiiM
VIEITGLRNPCRQIEAFHPGLLASVLGRDDAGNLVRKTGIMAVVIAGGDVKAGDAIAVVLPQGKHHPLLQCNRPWGRELVRRPIPLRAISGSGERRHCSRRPSEFQFRT